MNAASGLNYTRGLGAAPRVSGGVPPFTELALGARRISGRPSQNPLSAPRVDQAGGSGLCLRERQPSGSSCMANSCLLNQWAAMPAAASRRSRNCDREMVPYRPYLCMQGSYQRIVRKVVALWQGCAVGVRRQKGWRKNAPLLAHPAASIGHQAAGESEGRGTRKARKSAASGNSAAASSAGGRIITCRDASFLAHICAIDATVQMKTVAWPSRRASISRLMPDQSLCYSWAILWRSKIPEDGRREPARKRADARRHPPRVREATTERCSPGRCPAYVCLNPLPAPAG